jgi:histidine triad (HIT) family protein
MVNSKNFDFYCEEALSGKTKIKIVYESDHVLAFYHTKPIYEKHIVVISKKHIHNLSTVSDNDLTILYEMIKVCREIMKTYDFRHKGGRVITNLGIFQDTPHLHFHVICGEKIR